MQRGWTLLETMLALFLSSALIFLIVELSVVQRQVFEGIRGHIQDIYIALGIYQEFSNLITELRPFLCGVPGKYDSKNDEQSYQVADLNIIDMKYSNETVYIKVWASKGDMLVQTKRNTLLVPHCLESMYMVSDLHRSMLVEGFSCLGDALLLTERLPRALLTPFLIMPVYFKEYIISPHQLRLHASGVAQVLVSGFKFLRLQIGKDKWSLELGLSTFKPISMEFSLCPI